MIDLTEFQNKVYETTKRLGYIVNKKNTIKQLKEEIKELKKAKFVSPSLVHFGLNIQDDNKFVEFFEKRLKNTIADEIPDMAFILMSYSKSIGHDIEELYMLKERYNLYRK